MGTEPTTQKTASSGTPASAPSDKEAQTQTAGNTGAENVEETQEAQGETPEITHSTSPDPMALAAADHR